MVVREGMDGLEGLPFIALTVEIPFVCFMQTAAKWPFPTKITEGIFAAQF